MNTATSERIKMSRRRLMGTAASATQITTYDGWNRPRDNANWKGADRYFQAATFFGPQSNTVLGNSTRFNPNSRTPWGLTENFSLAKSLRFTEALRLDFRFEIFNAFNRSRFDTGPRNVESLTFGRVTTTVNEPRRTQLGLKLYW